MQPIPFTAASAEEAVAQIRERLGPEAVVLNVRRLPSNGLARLWQKPMIEVLAYVPDAPAPEPEPFSVAIEEFRQQLNEIKQQVESRSSDNDIPRSYLNPVPTQPPQPLPTFHEEAPAGGEAGVEINNGNWRVGGILQRSGLLPLPAQQVIDHLHAQYGANPPPSLGEEIRLAQAVMSKFWRRPSASDSKALHVLVGPAGTGKTTCLCKWLTQAVLMEGRTARVWRLDGATANTAESLSVYCEILGVPSERAW